MANPIHNLQGHLLSAATTIIKVEPCKKRLADCGMTKTELTKLIACCIDRVDSSDIDNFVTRVQEAIFWREFKAHDTWEDFQTTLNSNFGPVVIDSMDVWRDTNKLLDDPRYLIARLLKVCKHRDLSTSEATRIMSAIDTESSTTIAEDLFGVLEKACDQVRLVTVRGLRSLDVQFDEQNSQSFSIQVI